MMTIQDFFKENNKIALAFSGGTDSAYLLCEAVHCGADVKAYYVKSALQPGFETRDAEELAEKLGCGFEILNVDVLSDPDVTANPADRCYYCKKRIMGTIITAARADGYELICDGTNASDDISDRPGYKALKELGIRSPLRDCGITKADVRKRSKDAGLATWSKPAYACLATRIKTGEPITAEKLAITEKAEGILFDMGYSDFRVRMRGDAALVQISKEQHGRAMTEEKMIKEAIGGLYSSVTIDPSAR